MKDFPQESIQQAREIVAKYRKRSTSKRDLSVFLYNKKFLEIEYGFSEAIKSGNCAKYLHEIAKEADCFTMAGVLYLIAREAGLKPQMYMGTGIKDFKEGEDPSEMGVLDHTFITVITGKNKIFMLDPNRNLFGRATFQPKRNTIEVYAKEWREVKYRKYASLEKISEKEYLDKFEENRSPKGGRLALSSTQKVIGAGKRNVFITYRPETQEIKSSMIISSVRFGPEAYNRSLVKDLITSVNSKGEFDFEKGNLLFYYVSAAGWSKNENPQIPLIYSVKDAQKIWQVFDKLVFRLGRKSGVEGMNPLKLTEMIKDGGFSDKFEIEESSKAEQIVKEVSLEETLSDIQKSQRRAVNKFVGKVEEDEISYKSILRFAHYVKAVDENKNKENPKKFVFSDKEHLKIIKKGFEDYKRHSIRLIRAVINNAKIRAGIGKRSSAYHLDRRFNVTFETEKRGTRYFDEMTAVYNSPFPLAFHTGADRELFFRQFDLETMPVSELEKGLTKADIKRAAQNRLFDWLILAYVTKEALFLASYKKGLQKILNQE